MRMAFADGRYYVVADTDNAITVYRKARGRMRRDGLCITLSEDDARQLVAVMMALLGGYTVEVK